LRFWGFIDALLAKVGHLAYKSAGRAPGPHPFEFEVATAEDT
jgi:hypothetical protein